jgi:DHA1 family multidrug resistance protein-like MFS transporter
MQSERRTLVAMAGVQFVISSAFSIIPPVIPLLLPTLGVHAAQETRVWAGVLLGVTPLAAALISPLWGRLAGRIDPRIILLIACSASGLCTIAMSVVTGPGQLLGLRFLMGFFGGHIVAAMALVSAATAVARLGWALSWLTTAQLAGTLLGPLIGGAIADAFGSYRAPFIATGTAGLLICAAILAVPRPAPRAAADIHAAEGRKSLTLLLRTPGLMPLVLIILIAQFSIMTPQSIVALHVRELVGARPELATLAGFAFSVLGLSGLIAAPLIGRCSDSLPTRGLLLTLAVAAAVFTLPQAYATSYTAFVAERFGAGLFLAGIIPVVNALIGRRIPSADRSRAYGITSGVTFFGAFIGPVVGGLVGAHLGLSSVFLLCGAMLCVLAAYVRVVL